MSGTPRDNVNKKLKEYREELENEYKAFAKELLIFTYGKVKPEDPNCVFTLHAIFVARSKENMFSYALEEIERVKGDDYPTSVIDSLCRMDNIITELKILDDLLNK